jgi:hypothetical protein
MTAESFFSGSRWVYRVAAFIVHVLIAYFLTRALSGDLETLIVCCAGVVYSQARLSGAAVGSLVAEMRLDVVQDFARIGGHLGCNTPEQTKEVIQYAHDAALKMTGSEASELARWAAVELVFAWPLAKLFWGRLMS